VAGALKECGEKKIPGAVLIPSGFAETGNVELQDQIVAVAREYNVRLMGPNITAFTTRTKSVRYFLYALRHQGKAALSSQSGGVECDYRVQPLREDGSLRDCRLGTNPISMRTTC